MKTLQIISILILVSFFVATSSHAQDVGIHTDTPQASLHIKDDNESIRLDGTAPFLSWYNGDHYRGYIQMDGNKTMWLSNNTNGSIAFRTNAKTRMAITGDGNVGIGTINPTAKLTVSGNTYISGDADLGGITKVKYLYPNLGSGDPYRYIRLGTPSEHFGGFMHNISDPSFGDGNDFTIFSYSNRDIVLRPGTGKVNLIGGTDVNAREGGIMVYGKLDAPNIGIDNNEIQARNNGVASQLAVNYEGGNVVLGGPTPDKRFCLNTAGNVGIGTTNPTEGVHVKKADFLIENGNTSLHFRADGTNTFINNMNDFVGNGVNGNGNLVITGQNDLRFRTGDANSSGIDRLIIKNDGNVGIGTSTIPVGYKLAVNGKIIGEELVIKLSQNWADYVFLPSYNLLSLEEIEEHIEENGCLHNIPSAKKIEEDGLTVGKITVNQQEKIEELYLHMIEMNKTVKALQTQNEQLQAELLVLKGNK